MSEDGGRSAKWDLAPGLLSLADDFIHTVRSCRGVHELRRHIEAVTREMGFKYYALVHYDDLRVPRPDRVDIKDYPQVVVDRFLDRGRYRRDPIVRGCLVAGSAFRWSEIGDLIRLDRHDRLTLEFGAREALNEGITVPYIRLGDCAGSCTFAGMRHPGRASRLLGPAQMIGVFAFQAALRMLGSRTALISPPRLHPRPRDCVVLAGQGLSNKQIARVLALTPRTVDGYLTEARALFDAHGRTELVTAAVLAGEISVHELRRCQTE